MYSVGILSGTARWPEVLTEMLGSSGPTVSGWIDPVRSPEEDVRQLIDYSDLVWIPEKSDRGVEEAIRVIRRSRHLYLGIPVADFMEEAGCMVSLAHEARVQVQVGHHDWYHPAVRSALPVISHPQHIRFIHHLPPSAAEDGHSQVFRALVADIDLALGLAGSTVRRVRPHAARLADGTATQVDIRIELHNGAVISLLARKFSTRTERHIELVQSGGIVRIDLQKGTSEFSGFGSESGRRPHASRKLWPPSEDHSVAIIPEESEYKEIARHCVSFIHALEKGRHPLPSLEGGFKALEVTRQAAAALGSF